MTIYISGCNGRNGNHYFEIIIPAGTKDRMGRLTPRVMKEQVNYDYWSREAATAALDTLENLYYLRRCNVRFVEC